MVTAGTSAALIVFLVAVVIAVVLSTVLKFNIGIAGLLAAYILGVVVMHMSAGQMAALFPTSIFMTQLVVTLFFGFALCTGVFKGVGDRVIYKFRNKPWAVPIITAIAGFIVGTIGAGNEATPLVMSPLAFAFAAEAGFNPLIAAIAVYFGSCGSGAFPWHSGVLLFGFAQDALGVEAGSQAVWATNIMLIITLGIMFIFTYFFLGGHKTKQLPDMAKPEPFDAKQKAVLAVVLIVLAILILPNVINTIAPNPVTTWIKTYLDLRVMCLIGSFICICLKLADPREVLMTKVPWGLLVMIAGMCMLMNVGNTMGVVDMAGAWIGSSVPARLVPAAICLIMGALSFVTNGITLWPLFCGMAPGISAACGVDPMVIVACVMGGTMPSGFSPISTGGAMATIGADDETRQKIFWPQMGVALFGVVINCILALVGAYDWAVAILG